MFKYKHGGWAEMLHVHIKAGETLRGTEGLLKMYSWQKRNSGRIALHFPTCASSLHFYILHTQHCLSVSSPALPILSILSLAQVPRAVSSSHPKFAKGAHCLLPVAGHQLLLVAASLMDPTYSVPNPTNLSCLSTAHINSRCFSSATSGMVCLSCPVAAK